MADVTYAAPAELELHRLRALMAGVAGLFVCAIGFFVARDHLFRAWLIAYLLWLGVSLGSMAFVMINHLSGGSWGVFRRVFEASARTLPLLALLFLPIVVGMQTLYPWTHADLVGADEVLRHKSTYLNTGFFLVRALAYFAGWILLAWRLTALSRRQDEGDMSVNLALQKLSGGGLVFYALSVIGIVHSLRSAASRTMRPAHLSVIVLLFYTVIAAGTALGPRATARLRAPVMPLLCPYAAIGAVRLAHELQRRRTPTEPVDTPSE